MKSHKIYRMALGVLLVILTVKSFMQWELLGFTNAEVFGHVWSHSWRLEDFPSGLFGTDKTIGTLDFPLIDPIPSVIVGVLQKFFPLSSAYNFLFVLVVFLNVLVVGRLIGRNNSNLNQQKAMGVLLFTSPIVWGSLNSGLTEDWGLFFPICTLVAIEKRKIGLAGVLLAASAYWGLVLGWMSAIVVSLYALLNRVEWKKLFLFWLVTGVCVLPLLGLHWERLGLEGHRSVAPPNRWEPMWMLNPWHHTDVASLFWMGPVDFQSHIIRLHPASLGLGAMIVSIGCRDLIWWSLFIFCVGCSFGPELYWMGNSLGVSNPMHALLQLFPGSELLNHHGRWMLMAVLCWIVIVVKGMSRFNVLRWMTPVIAIEWLFATPLGFPVMGTPKIENSSVLISLQEFSMPQESRLLRVPIRGPNVVFQLALYEQTVHDLPLWMNPNRPNPSDWFPLSQNTQWIESIAFTKSLPVGACTPEKVEGVLVAEPFTKLFIETWGEPNLKDSQYAFWSSHPRCVGQ